MLLGPPEKPINVTILGKTHKSITIRWKVGLNGGSPQHFKVLYREKGKENLQESQNNITAIKTGEGVNYTIHGLNAKTEYEITVVAINKFKGRSQSEAVVHTVTTEGKTSVALQSTDHLHSHHSLETKK